VGVLISRSAEFCPCVHLYVTY